MSNRDLSSAPNIGSDVDLVATGSSGTDAVCLEKIELPASVNLSFCERELGDSPFRLSDGPMQGYGGTDSGLILDDAAGERGDQT